MSKPRLFQLRVPPHAEHLRAWLDDPKHRGSHSPTAIFLLDLLLRTWGIDRIRYLQYLAPIEPEIEQDLKAMADALVLRHQPGRPEPTTTPTREPDPPPTKATTPTARKVDPRVLAAMQRLAHRDS